MILPEFTLKDINLDIQKNDFFSLIGPTGSGKSLLLEGIMGLIPFSSGHLFFKNCDITDLAVEKRNLAIVYQNFALFPHLNVTQNIFYGVSYHKIPRKTAKKKFDLLVSSLGLEKIIERHPYNLSGGEKKLLAFGMGLIHKPILLLFDEPFAGVDQNTTKQIINIFEKNLSNFNNSCIIVEHKDVTRNIFTRKVNMTIGTIKN